MVWNSNFTYIDFIYMDGIQTEDLSEKLFLFFFVFLSLSACVGNQPYINDFLISETPVYSTIQETCTDFVQKQSSDLENEMESSSQFIDGLNLPEILRKNIEKNNNTENYAELSVNTLTEYVSGYLARTIVNGLSYVLAYILATIGIRIVVYILNLIAGLPVLKTANKLTGGAGWVCEGSGIYMDIVPDPDGIVQYRDW